MQFMSIASTNELPLTQRLWMSVYEKWPNNKIFGQLRVLLLTKIQNKVFIFQTESQIPRTVVHYWIHLIYLWLKFSQYGLKIINGSSPFNFVSDCRPKISLDILKPFLFHPICAIVMAPQELASLWLNNFGNFNAGQVSKAILDWFSKEERRFLIEEKCIEDDADKG